MGFQILDKEGNAIGINKIDEEVAKFWGVEVDKKHYAYPTSTDEKRKWRMISRNWFDTICYLIHSQKLTSWDMVLMAFMEPYINMNLDEWNSVPYDEKIKEIFTWPDQKPYLDLILYWKEQGYKPKPVED